MLKGVKRVLRGVTGSYIGSQKCKGGCKRLQGVTGVTRGYMGLEGVKGGYTDYKE